MIEISRRRMDTFRCEILRINPYSVARSCQRTLESLISMRGFWCTSGCVTSRYGFHGSPTIPRRHELERIGRSSFQKEIFIRFHKQNKNFEISFQKMDFNFVFTNREKGNVRTKWWNTSVILLLTNNIDISRKSRSWTDRITDKIWSLFWTIYTLRRFSSRAVFAVTCHDADSSDF